MKIEFEKLKILEKNRKITIGVDKNNANNFLYNQTMIGKILNWLTYVFILLTIAIFIKFGFLNGILAIAGIAVYTVAVQKIASMHARIMLLQNEKLFDVAYQVKSITIRNNSSGEIIVYPTDWKKEIADI